MKKWERRREEGKKGERKEGVERPLMLVPGPITGPWVQVARLKI